jgi:hypothetical protein
MIWHANLHSCCLLAGREELLGDQAVTELKINKDKATS